MKAPWEYLEHLHEIVYVVHSQTNDLVYMNSYAKEQFALADDADYLGHKCYELLQGSSSPCSFCGGAERQQRQTAAWTCRNAKLNRSLIQKDTPILWNGQQYRMTVAAEVGDQPAAGSVFLQYDALVNDCLLESHATQDPEQSIRIMLRFLGVQLSCRRVDVYERLSNGELTRSYGWAMQENDAAPAAISETGMWERYAALCCSQPLLVSDIAELRRAAPSLAQFLELQDEQPLILIPLVRHGAGIGLLRLDVSGTSSPINITGIARLLSHFIVSAIAQRDMMRRLRHLSYHDQLTGAQNRYALEQHLNTIPPEQPVGLVMCDVIGLKQINDIQGHASGDRLIHRVYDSLASIFAPEDIYRMGGDEFLVVCRAENEGQLEILTDLLRRQLRTNNCGLSIGTAWAGAGEKNFRALIKQADDRMYREKQSFYEQSGAANARPHHARSTAALSQRAVRDPFLEFIQQYYFDSHSFFESVMPEDAPVYYYCGDMQRNVYYISDHLKQDFNFDDNLVVDFVALLEQRILEADKQRHIEDQKALLAEKKPFHSIYYRIYDRNDQPIWMHCQGIMQWNEDRSAPLFFSGIMTPTDPSHRSNPALNSRQLNHALQSIQTNRTDKTPMLFCLALNGFETINYLLGRRRGDALIWELISQLQSGLGEDFKLIRLEGTHLAALTCKRDDPAQVCRRIRQIVKEVYARNQVPLLYPCSVGVLPELRVNISAQELLVKASAVLRAAEAVPETEYIEFTPEMSNNYRYAVNLSVALNRCVNRQFEGFRMVVQPQVHCRTGEVFGGEALLRWQYQGIDIAPSEFIPILERTELIIPVGKWIVSQVAHICQSLLAIMPDFHLSFNVSYHQILDKNFFPFIRREMESRRIPGQNIFIELTETHFDDAPELLDLFLRQCRDAGFHFALDDFGSAYSNFQLLLQHPADLVKLDRNLTQEITTSQDKMNFIMSIIYACHKFKKLVCVEGVETEEELAAVRQTECDYIQGFHFHRPLELDALYRLVSEQANR